MSSHLDEEQAVALSFGDGTPADAAHAAECAECASAVSELRAMLASVDAGAIPERGEDYGSQVWERLQRSLEMERRRRRRAVLQRRTITWGALAASLVIAFLAGRQFPKPPAAVAQAIPEASRERILLLAVGEHLERSQVLLVELSNAGPEGAVDRPAARESAEALVTANRLYRTSALNAGDTGVASVLEELERVLVEVAHEPPGASAKSMERIRKRIEDRGLLFKVRVIESQVRERGNEGRPVAAPDFKVS
jgi:hypothetical protein